MCVKVMSYSMMRVKCVGLVWCLAAKWLKPKTPILHIYKNCTPPPRPHIPSDKSSTTIDHDPVFSWSFYSDRVFDIILGSWGVGLDQI